MNKPRENMKSRWSLKYKRSINCSKPKGFSQKNYCKRQKQGGKYKSFKEWLNENEQVKTPGGYTLTPEELEDYENERSPMYKALFLKDIDAKRKTQEKSPEKIVTKEVEKDQQDQQDQQDLNKLYPIEYCFQIINAIRALQEPERKEYGKREVEAIISEQISNFRYRYRGQLESINQQIMDILEKSHDKDSIYKKIKPIMEKLGMKIPQKVGDRSKFDPEIHQIYLASIKPGEDVVLVSDLITLGGDVYFKANAFPINEFTLKNYKDIIDNPEKNKQPVHFT